MRRIRLIWAEPPNELQGWEADADEKLLEQGFIEFGGECDFAGPSGRYTLLSEEIWRTMVPHDPAPMFLHDSYQAVLEKWVNSLPDAANEVAIVAKVRDAVIHLVESRLAADPTAFSASVTVTTTEPTAQGMAVVGRCVLLSPAGRRPPPAGGHPSPPAEGATRDRRSMGPA
jgi:hypothetical protein